MLFFLICFGLGYPTLNRYDPRQMLPDAAVYAQLATEGPAVEMDHFRFRVLIPSLVRPIYALAAGHMRSWDSLLFAFLVVNSFFVASTAFLLFQIGFAHLKKRSVALLGATLFLLNFAVPNDLLAGLVDSGECFFLMMMVVIMFFGGWWLLPALGVLGALTKESFVPFSIGLAVAWWLASSRTNRRSLVWIGCTIVAEFAAITSLQSAISGHFVSPWTFALGLNSHSNYVNNFFSSIADRNSWYILIWLLPLGLLGIRRIPKPWVAGCATATLVALILNAYYGGMGGAGGGPGRYIFNIAGPMLSLGAAGFLCSP